MPGSVPKIVFSNQTSIYWLFKKIGEPRRSLNVGYYAWVRTERKMILLEA
jgi:hypothetical protein